MPFRRVVWKVRESVLGTQRFRWGVELALKARMRDSSSPNLNLEGSRFELPPTLGNLGAHHV